MKLDAKFDGVIFKIKDQSIVPPDEYVVFLAKDNAFLPTLKFYQEECRRLGADNRQLAAVDEMIVRVARWRREHPERCKVPDVDKDEKLLIGSGAK